MIFNRTSGFLTLPVSGIYYLYSQVHMTVVTNFTKGIRLGHKTVVCSPRRNCNTIQEAAESTSLPAHLQSYSGLHTDKFAGHFHGGLFHFPAGTHVGIVTFWPSHRVMTDANITLELKFSALWQESFLGAYLVDPE